MEADKLSRVSTVLNSRHPKGTFQNGHTVKILKRIQYVDEKENSMLYCF